MKTPSKVLVAAAAVAACALTAVPAAKADNRAERPDGPSAATSCNFSRMDRPAIVLNDVGNLYCFDAARPRDARLLKSNPIATPSTMDTDPRLLGIDFRALDNSLWGIGTNNTLYKLNPQTGAVIVTRPLVQPGALGGATDIGVDFDPTHPDQLLWVVTAGGLSVRIDTGDGNVAANSALQPPPVNGVTAIAYTNNDTSATTGTTLFDVDTNPTTGTGSGPDQVFIQAPPNSGALHLTGNLSVDTNAPAAMDVYTSLRNGRANSNTTYLVINPVNEALYSDFYRLDPLTGHATLVGLFPKPVGRGIGLAVFL